MRFFEGFLCGSVKWRHPKPFMYRLKLLGWSYSEIGEIFGIDKSTVHKAFTEFTEVKTVNDLSADRG
jgi:GH25 family lysozyme M1 (1,4-beta-N-acetylmuramidase)